MNKFFKLSAVIALSFVILAGCGSTNNSNTTGNNEETSATNAAPTEETAKPVTLEYFTMQQVNAEGEKIINAALQEEYPNITVKFKHVADNYNVALKTRIAAGDAPDLFDGNGYIANGDYVKPDYVMDLTDTGLVDAVLPQFQDSGMYDGKVYGIPTLAQATGLIYNKTVFEQAGIAAPPKTLDELQQAIEKIKAIDITPIATGFKDVWVSHQMFWDILAPHANGGDFEQWYEDMNAGNASFATNEALKEQLALLDMVKDNTFDRPLTSDINNLTNNLATDKAGMAFQGVWTYPSNIVNIDPDAPLSLVPFPVSNNPDDALMLYSAQGIAFVSKDTKYSEEAINFLKWMTTKSGVETYTKILDQASPIKTDAELDIKNPLSIDANEYVQAGGKTVGFVKTYWPNGFQDTVGKELQRYIGNEIDKETFLKNLDTKWNELKE